MLCDEDGQPLNIFYNLENNLRKKTNFLWGMCSGASADRIIKPVEVELIFNWLQANQTYLSNMNNEDILNAISHFRSSGKISTEVALYFREIADSSEGSDFFLGMCMGVIGDNIITTEEAKALKRWLMYSAESIDSWVIDNLYKRLKEMLKDGVIDNEEQIELKEILRSIVGNPEEMAMGAQATTLPLNKPEPCVSIAGSTFCLTGNFVSGNRNEIYQKIISTGGIAKTSVTLDLDYLVIGNMASRDWKHESYGTKISKAMEYRDIKGKDIKIITEKHLVDHFNM